MVDPIKQYAPLDLTDFNKIINLGDPTLVHDAATKGYVDGFNPLTMPGDLLYETASGSRVLSTQSDIVSPVSGYAGIRVAECSPGHAIHVTWEARSTFAERGQWIRGFLAAGSVYHSQSAGAAHITSGSFAAFSQDFVLGAGETEVQLFIDGDDISCFVQNLVYTDITATAPDRIPIGDETQVLTVVDGLPAWADGNLPTADEKAALDAVPTALTALNPVASMADLPLAVRVAASVPTGAPGTGESPIALDTTAITGGLYVWDGTVWVKASTIP